MGRKGSGEAKYPLPEASSPATLYICPSICSRLTKLQETEISAQYIVTNRFQSRKSIFLFKIYFKILFSRE